MKIQVVGDIKKPVIVMLSGSFCPSACLGYIYEKMQDDYCIVLPEYGGHYENSTFTTRANEASQITDYLVTHNMTHIRMIYGQSMGSEVGIELLRQLTARDIVVDHCFFDGAPCVELSAPYKKLMYFKFKTLANMMKKKNSEEILQSRLLKKFSKGDTESLRPMVESISMCAPYLTKESIKNETECCYTFDFPKFDEKVQREMYFLYAKEEKAYRACYAGVKAAYPKAKYNIVEGYGHLTYSVKHTDEYVKRLKEICGE